jgi:hypothetical protein
MAGYGTKTDRNSPAAHATKRDRAEYTKGYEAGAIVFPVVEILTCTCRSFRFAHDPARHRELSCEYDWRTQEQRGNVEYWEPFIR